MNKIKIYRLPFFTRLMMFLSTTFFSVISYFAFNDQQGAAGYVFVGFASLGLFAFVWSLHTVRITDQEIAVTNFLKTKSINWNEISYVIHKSDGFRLRNHDEDVSLNISAQVENFFGIIEAINRFAPHAWTAQDIKVFHPSGVGLGGTFLFTSFGIAMIVVTIKGFAEGGESLLTLGFLFVIGIISTCILFIMPLKISIEDDYLVITRLIGKRRIHVLEIDSVAMNRTMQHYAYHYQTYIKLKNGKSLPFANLREGAFAVSISLEKWLQKYNNPTKQE